MHLVPSECWVGPADTVPGLVAGIPPQIKDLDKKEAFCPRTTLYVHKVRISSLNEIEAAFSQYLTGLCISTENQPNQRALNVVKAVVQERKLTVASHNTWQ